MTEDPTPPARPRPSEAARAAAAQRAEAVRAAAAQRAEAVRAAAAQRAEAVRVASAHPVEAVRTAAANHPPKPDRLGDPTTSVSVWNAANGLTMMRIALVPLFVYLLLQDGGHDPVWRAYAWAAFAVASISDRFDGMLARRHGLVTDFGKLVDPIADKALMGAALIGLSALGDLPWWVTGVVLFREIGITVMRFWVIKRGVIPASRGGKLKTMLQGTAIGMYVLVMTGPLATFRAWMMALAVIATVVTGIDYVVKALRGGTPAAAAAEGESDGGIAAVPADMGRTE
ncbi:CDP-diacylglycerol--glycerol-3-phosphate 3-phosphatidyltransferase [Yinghuangia soli]|uniref:CDP-diacylglycerol--glycerol-3-phosphate 3-phosphatidyltransferase n=1 Tax=Yinghuangia soli TaxID=2908204 RepID=A0AA41Q747_9ACTN|nr:CDP-diacylglycerol--glycerol-3-phosphate 3-phosphatidyltransferase [Yinghuangia soli]MCF2532803.1 CDP-diacylglycerol--glycerol-3-phosphate 3-phosphatidyltransferase [Yinghuangia soli]